MSLPTQTSSLSLIPTSFHLAPGSNSSLPSLPRSPRTSTQSPVHTTLQARRIVQSAGSNSPSQNLQDDFRKGIQSQNKKILKNYLSDVVPHQGAFALSRPAPPRMIHRPSSSGKHEAASLKTALATWLQFPKNQASFKQQLKKLPSFQTKRWSIEKLDQLASTFVCLENIDQPEFPIFLSLHEENRKAWEVQVERFLVKTAPELTEGQRNHVLYLLAQTTKKEGNLKEAFTSFALAQLDSDPDLSLQNPNTYEELLQQWLSSSLPLKRCISICKIFPYVSTIQKNIETDWKTFTGSDSDWAFLDDSFYSEFYEELLTPSHPQTSEVTSDLVSQVFSYLIEKRGLLAFHSLFDQKVAPIHWDLPSSQWEAPLTELHSSLAGLFENYGYTQHEDHQRLFYLLERIPGALTSLRAHFFEFLLSSYRKESKAEKDDSTHTWDWSQPAHRKQILEEWLHSELFWLHSLLDFVKGLSSQSQQQKSFDLTSGLELGLHMAPSFIFEEQGSFQFPSTKQVRQVFQHHQEELTAQQSLRKQQANAAVAFFQSNQEVSIDSFVSDALREPHHYKSQPSDLVEPFTSLLRSLIPELCEDLHAFVSSLPQEQGSSFVDLSRHTINQWLKGSPRLKRMVDRYRHFEKQPALEQEIRAQLKTYSPFRFLHPSPSAIQEFLKELRDKAFAIDTFTEVRPTRMFDDCRQIISSTIQEANDFWTASSSWPQDWEDGLTVGLNDTYSDCDDSKKRRIKQAIQDSFQKGRPPEDFDFCHSFSLFLQNHSDKGLSSILKPSERYWLIIDWVKESTCLRSYIDQLRSSSLE